MFAGGFRLVLFQPCKPRAEQHLVALFDALGEWIGLAEKILGFCLCELQSLPGFFLVR